MYLRDVLPDALVFRTARTPLPRHLDSNQIVGITLKADDKIDRLIDKPVMLCLIYAHQNRSNRLVIVRARLP
nr:MULTISPECIES: hypothetical protein [unclassified Rhizobium]